MFYINKYIWLTSLFLGMTAAVLLTTPAQAQKSKAAIRIDQQVDAALKELYKSSPAARRLQKNAKAILVFPTIVKAGFGFGGATGYGSLRQNGKTTGYYDTFTASYGFQAGLQSFGYALFFMDKNSLSYLDKSGGFELGVGPSIVILNEGAAKSVTTTTTQQGIYAITFSQAGLMGGAGIQGSKISRFYP